MFTQIWTSPLVLGIALAYAVFEAGQLIIRQPYTLKQSNLTWIQRARLFKRYYHAAKMPTSARRTATGIIFVFGYTILTPWLSDLGQPLIILSLTGLIWLLWIWLMWSQGHQQMHHRRDYWQRQQAASPFELIDAEAARSRQLTYNRLIMAIAIVAIDYVYLAR